MEKITHRLSVKDFREGNTLFDIKRKIYIDFAMNIGRVIKHGVIPAKLKYSPVNLTVDILQDFGFTLSEDQGDVKFFEKGKFSVKWYDGDEFYFCVNLSDDSYFIIREIYFVHELQNIYYDLREEELIFNYSKYNH